MSSTGAPLSLAAPRWWRSGRPAENTSPRAGADTAPDAEDAGSTATNTAEPRGDQVEDSDDNLDPMVETEEFEDTTTVETAPADTEAPTVPEAVAEESAAAALECPICISVPEQPVHDPVLRGVIVAELYGPLAALACEGPADRAELPQQACAG